MSLNYKWRREGGYFYKDEEYKGKADLKDNDLDLFLAAVNFVENHPEKEKILKIVKVLEESDSEYFSKWEEFVSTEKIKKHKKEND